MSGVQWADLPISPEHAKFLDEHAIRPGIAAAQGVRTIATPADLPTEFAWVGEHHASSLPAIAFPWRTPGGRELVQLRPDLAIELEGEKRPARYLWPKGCGSPIGIVRTDDEGPVIFVEGTKQALAAAGYVETGAVYAIAGCRSWSREGVPEVDLDVVEGRSAIVIFDADVETNPDVYDAAKKLLRALEQEGATNVRFALLAAGGKAGLDDVLGKRPEEKRTAYMRRLIDGAKASLGKRPAAKKAEPVALGTHDRPPVAVNDDRLKVIDGITAALRRRWNGNTLFCFGRVLAERDGATMEPIEPKRFFDLVQQASTTVTVSEKGDMVYAEPTSGVLGAALSRARQYTQLDRIALMPFVRADGTICQTAGYDPASRSFLVEALPVTVPDDPTEDEVAAARKLLCDEWLGDLLESMPDEASRANTLAVMLTPLVRGLVPVVPMAVVNGLQMGVGKNLIGDMLAIYMTGNTVLPLPWADDDDERRKSLLAAFRTGRELFVFDEAHVIEGASLARALTAATYTDRILGVSTTAEFPNNVTWMSLGNNVQINGDMSRRVFVIRLAPAVENPQDRDVDSFRHPDLRGWAIEHRAELVAAGLTLVRAWFAAGRPQSKVGRRFGSFEAWGGMVGGILEVAGINGFLGNLQEWRSESDYESRYWVDHFRWLGDRYPEGETFTVAEVVKAMKSAAGEVEHPPGLVDHTVIGYARSLGQAYGKVKGRTYAGRRLTLVSASPKHGNRWVLEGTGMPEKETVGTSSGEFKVGDDGGSPPPTRKNHFNSPTGETRDVFTGEGAERSPASPLIPPTKANAQVDSDNPVSSGALAGSPTRGTNRTEPFRTGAKEDVVMAHPTRPWSPAPDPDRSPAASVLDLAVETMPPKYGACPECETTLAPVPPHRLWRACPVCHEGTFTR